MKCRFRILVFQNEQFAEEVETETHEFADGLELANEMAKFAAMNHSLRLHSALRLMLQVRTKIQEPAIEGGLGPNTYLLIRAVLPAN